MYILFGLQRHWYTRCEAWGCTVFSPVGRSQNGQSCTIPVLCNKYAHVHLTASCNLVLRVLSEHCNDIIFEVNSTTLPFYINTLISKLVRHLHSPSFSASFTSVFVPWRLSSWHLSLPVSAMLLTCKQSIEKKIIFFSPTYFDSCSSLSNSSSNSWMRKMVLRMLLHEKIDGEAALCYCMCSYARCNCFNMQWNGIDTYVFSLAPLFLGLHINSAESRGRLLQLPWNVTCCLWGEICIAVEHHCFSLSVCGWCTYHCFLQLTANKE